MINDDKKVVAFYIGSLARGGAERVMINLASHFHKQGYKVYLVTKTVDEPEYDVPENIKRLIADIEGEEISSSRIRNLYRRIMKLRRIWRDIKPDIVLSFIRKNNLMAIASTRGLRIPVVVGIRSNPERELKGRGFKYLSFALFRHAAGIVLQTTRAGDYFPRYLQKKIVVMPNSISESYVDVSLSTNRKHKIVLVGRIDDNKNQKMVLETFSQIADKYPMWSLHLYGDGQKHDKLKDKYENEHIIFHGSVADVKECIKDASIYILPSKEEGMPNALIEAMALGLACISTDCPCGGPADLIESEVNGILIPVDDREALCKHLVRLMEDENLRNALGTEASKIIERVRPDKVNQMWEEYLAGKMR